VQLEVLSARLARAFPELAGAVACRVLASGFRSTVVETNTGIVFRIGKNQAAAEGFAREVKLLPVLAGQLPCRVPNPHWYSPPSMLFPFGVMGYRKLPGVPLSPQHLAPSLYSQPARDIAHFLAALHRFPVQEAAARGVRADRGAAAWLASISGRVLPELRRRLPEAEYARLDQWWQAVIADHALNSYEPVLRHGDLWYENILMDVATGRVSGMLDFEHIAIGDRAQDFATQLHMGAGFARLVVDEYRKTGSTVEADFAHRMAVWWQLRELDGVDFALQSDDAVELEDAIHKLRRGPVFSACIMDP
jgi:aminoglycoside phosphotransferase (APT) family kinase protein